MKWVSIALFGALGGIVRLWLATTTVGPRETWMTILLNLFGAFVLGYLSTTQLTSSWPAWLKTGISAGFLGALTTFSGFLGDVVAWSQTDLFVAAGVLGGTVFGGLFAAFAGLKLGLRTNRRQADNSKQNERYTSQTHTKELIS